MDPTATELSRTEVNLAAGELGVLKLTSPPENQASLKETSPPENSARRSRLLAGELGPAEENPAAGEPGPLKRTMPPVNSGAEEIAAVEDNVREVEVQALPGHRGVF